MLKLSIAASVATMFSIIPALADKMMKCDEPSMTEMQKKIDADVTWR